MAPLSSPHLVLRASTSPLGKNLTREQAISEAWAQGFNVGSVVILILFVLCNYRRRILLHKLILLELFLALWHGIFIFFADPAYGWILSSTATLLYISYNMHNIVSWLKIKPFLPRWGGWVFIISLMLAQPYWVLETWANFQYFNELGSDLFQRSRYFEPLMRDPWWIFTTVKLVMVINKNYEYTLPRLVRTSPRFGIMLLCMFLSIVFLATDVAVTARVSKQSGINPFWRFSLVFKCASDAIFLDDFKSVLDHIAESALRRINNGTGTYSSTHKRTPSRPMMMTGGHSHNQNVNAGPVVTISADNRGGHNDVGGGGGDSERGRGIVNNCRPPWSSAARRTRTRRSSSRDSGRHQHPKIVTTQEVLPKDQIVAETTIVISNQSDTASRHVSSDDSGSGSGSEGGGGGGGVMTGEEGVNNSRTTSQYGWEEYRRRQQQLQQQQNGGGDVVRTSDDEIPMMPMRARTVNR